MTTRQMFKQIWRAASIEWIGFAPDWDNFRIRGEIEVKEGHTATAWWPAPRKLIQLL